MSAPCRALNVAAEGGPTRILDVVSRRSMPTGPRATGAVHTSSGLWIDVSSLTGSGAGSGTRGRTLRDARPADPITPSTEADMERTRVWEHPGLPGDPSVEVSWPRRHLAQITLLGEHDLASKATLECTIEELLSESTHLVIDLTQTEFIDSTTVRTLVSAERRATSRAARHSLQRARQRGHDRPTRAGGHRRARNTEPSRVAGRRYRS